nr:immunoglobulin light chain junction region [Macaca mulatta]
CQQVNKHPSSF